MQKDEELNSQSLKRAIANNRLSYLTVTDEMTAKLRKSLNVHCATDSVDKNSSIKCTFKALIADL